MHAVDAALQVDVDAGHVHLRGRLDRPAGVDVEVGTLEDAGVGEDEVEPLVPRHEGRLEGRPELGVVGQVRLVEGGVGHRGGHLLPFRLLDIDNVDLPPAARGEGLDNCQSHATGFESNFMLITDQMGMCHACSHHASHMSVCVVCVLNLQPPVTTATFCEVKEAMIGSLVQSSR